MKRLFLLLVVAMAMTPGLRAQTYYAPLDQHHSISVGYGVSAIDLAFSALIDGTHLRWQITDKEYLALTTSGLSGGNYNVGYSYRFDNNWLSIGGAFSINNLSINVEDYYFRIPLVSGRALSALGMVRFDFARTKMCRFYTTAGLGVSCLTGRLLGSKALKGSVWMPSFHTSLFGFEVQPIKQLSAFVELGIGMQGIAQVGIARRF